jgi:gas vesicle protein
MKRFVIGFLIGATAGATVVVLVTPKAGKELKRIAKERLDTAIETGKQAAASHEQEMWVEFRRRLDSQVNGQTESTA